MVEFGCVGAEEKWGTVLVFGVVCGFVVYLRKIRPTQLLVELSWVVAKNHNILKQSKISCHHNPELYLKLKRHMSSSSSSTF